MKNKIYISLESILLLIKAPMTFQPKFNWIELCRTFYKAACKMQGYGNEGETEMVVYIQVSSYINIIWNL